MTPTPTAPSLLAAILAFMLAVATAGAGSAGAPAGIAPYSPPAAVPAPGTILVPEGGGSRTLSIAEIERLPMVEMVEATIFDPAPMRFQGVLLRDVVGLIGLADRSALTLRAVDGFAVEIPRADWERWPVLLATRVDGRPLSVRLRGPARIVYPRSLHPELDTTVHHYRNIWLLTEVE